jgi:hypothetical protein
VQPARALDDSATITAAKTTQQFSGFERNAPIFANGRLKN